MTYDLAKMIEYCVKRGFIQRDWYIADIQLGNEVMSGAGETWLERFAVTVNSNSAPER